MGLKQWSENMTQTEVDLQEALERAYRLYQLLCDNGLDSNAEAIIEAAKKQHALESARENPMPNKQPATAYDYRRVIALVQVLAMDSPHDGIRALCAAWNIEPATKYFKDLHIENPVIDTIATIQRLAQHALESARETD